ncbi:hypothetical protein J3459_016142 [Metarhizium acridum]|nr:hypothetical protein J3459_016142 [Metarhizium acridum]
MQPLLNHWTLEPRRRNSLDGRKIDAQPEVTSHDAEKKTRIDGHNGFLVGPATCPSSLFIKQHLSERAIVGSCPRMFHILVPREPRLGYRTCTVLLRPQGLLAVLQSGQLVLADSKHKQ